MKKSLAIIIACALVSGAALVGANIVFANSGITDQSSSDETAASVHERKNYLEFTPAKRIFTDLYSLSAQVNKQDNEKITKKIIKKFGYDPRVDNSDNSPDISGACSRIAIDYLNEKMSDIFDKMEENGYGESIHDIIYSGEGINESNITRYCDAVIMAVNAYNDPEYEMSDVDRSRLLEWFFGAYFTLDDYGYKGMGEDGRIMTVDYIPDEVGIAAEAAVRTYEAEYGHLPR